MSEEEKNETKCICQHKGFRKFVVIALGTFVGVYCALSLFAAIHKPPMYTPCRFAGGYGMQPPIAAPCPCYHHRHHFDKFQKPDRGNFVKVIRAKQEPAPFAENK